MKYSDQILNKSKKISVVGCSGGGKSTLALFLSKKLKLPCHHIDTLFWKTGWVQSSQEELREKLKPIISSDEWILDGTFDSSFDLRLPKTDLIIIIDLPRLTCLYRAITRVFKYNKKNRRPDMADGCDESFDFEFYKYIWNYKRDVLPKVLSAIKIYGLEDKVIHLRTQKEVEEFKKHTT